MEGKQEKKGKSVRKKTWENLKKQKQSEYF